MLPGIPIHWIPSSSYYPLPIYLFLAWLDSIIYYYNHFLHSQPKMLPHTSLWNKRLLWTFLSPTSSLPHCLLSAFLLCKRFISSFRVPVHLCLGYQPILPSQGFCYFLVCIFITLALAEIILKLKVKRIEICNWSWIIWVFWIIWHSQMLRTPCHYYFLLSEGLVHTITNTPSKASFQNFTLFWF